MKNVTVIDRTLPEMEKDSTGTLLFREKAAFVSTVESFGVDCVELPAMRSSREDLVVFKTLAAALKRCAVSVAADPKTGSAAEAWDAVKDHARPVLRVELPVSTVQMEYQAHLKEDAMLARIGDCCRAAAALCPAVDFVAEDAARADAAYLQKALLAAKEAGATAFTLCEDAGDRLPEQVAALVRTACETVDGPLYVRLSDRNGLALACALAALKAGADGVKTAVSGQDVLKTDALSRALKTFGQSIGVTCGLADTLIHSDIKKMTARIDTARLHSAQGTAADDAAAIYLDAESSIDQVKDAALLLGYELSDGDLGKVYDSVISVCRKKHSIEGKELEAVIASAALQVPSTYHLDNYLISTGNLTASMAQVKLVKDGEKLDGVASGDGPIDAAFNAIDSGIGHHYELDDLQISAVTEGKAALGAALVRLRSNGRLYSGNGLSTDIVGASVRAYINALNKIVYEEQ